MEETEGVFFLRLGAHVEKGELAGRFCVLVVVLVLRKNAELPKLHQNGFLGANGCENRIQRQILGGVCFFPGVVGDFLKIVKFQVEIRDFFVRKLRCKNPELIGGVHINFEKMQKKSKILILQRLAP